MLLATAVVYSASGTAAAAESPPATANPTAAYCWFKRDLGLESHYMARRLCAVNETKHSAQQNSQPDATDQEQAAAPG